MDELRSWKKDNERVEVLEKEKGKGRFQVLEKRKR